MSGPVGILFNALQREISQGSEYGLFIDNEQRAKILTAVFDAYYHRTHRRSWSSIPTDCGRRSLPDTWRTSYSFNSR
jgi:hypothetical protein